MEKNTLQIFSVLFIALKLQTTSFDKAYFKIVIVPYSLKEFMLSDQNY